MVDHPASECGGVITLLLQVNVVGDNTPPVGECGGG